MVKTEPHLHNHCLVTDEGGAWMIEVGRAPPLTLATVEEVRAFTRGLRTRSAQELLHFAETTRLQRPLALCLAQPVIAVPLHRATARIRRFDEMPPSPVAQSVCRDLVAAALIAPAPYDRAVELLVRLGDESVGGSREQPLGDTVLSSTTPLADVRRMLSNRDYLEHLLSKALRIYLNTRNPAAGAFLRQSLCLLLLYDRFGSGRHSKRTLDVDLTERCRSLDLNSHELPDGIRRVMNARLREVTWSIFRPHWLHFLGHFQDRILKLSLPANLKTNLFPLMRRAVDGDPAAQSRVTHVIEVFSRGLADGEFTRLRSHMQNFFDKIAATEGVIERLFGDRRAIRKRDKADEGPNAGGLLNGDLVIERVLVDPAFLTCYAAKDYREFLKGVASHDCTSEPRLAAQQLANRRFFNVRLFHREAWVGNVYLLDFTDRAVPTVVVDKIQAKEPEKYLPETLFGDLLRGVVGGMLGPVGARVIAPEEAISNSSHIRSCYQTECRRRTRVGFRMTAAESAFESSRLGDFVVLSGSPAPQGAHCGAAHCGAART